MGSRVFASNVFAIKIKSTRRFYSTPSNEFIYYDIKSRLKSHVQTLCKPRTPFEFDHTFAQAYITQQLQMISEDQGDRKSIEILNQNFKFDEHSHTNIIAKVSKSYKSNPNICVIGAHYDTVPGSPGADDNTSAVSVLLELVRLYNNTLSPTPTSPTEIWFTFFDMEEHGMVGSDALATYFKTRKSQLDFAVSLEMLGYFSNKEGSQKYPTGPASFLKYLYGDRGDYLALIGNVGSFFKMRKLKRSLRSVGVNCHYLLVPFQGKHLPITRRSDHSPFWDEGFNSFMVTDTAELRNPNYHQETDTIDTLDFDQMTKTCIGLNKFLQS